MAEHPRADGRRAALVYNPIKVDKKKLRARMEQLSKNAGWGHPLFYETTIEDLGQDATARALADRVDAVVVAGGDGTVRAVTEALANTGVPLSIVPSGTGNLLARNIGLPLSDPDKMIEATFSGDTAAIDVATAVIVRADRSEEEHVFVVMAGIGLDAAMIANTNSQLKKTVGWVAYVDGAARSLPKARAFRVAFQLDGQRVRSTKVHSILFANCGRLPAGIELIPGASFADGQLDVAIIQPTGGWLGWFHVWRRVWWDNSVLLRSQTGRKIVSRRRNTAVRYLRGTEIDTAAEVAHPVQLDGDEFGDALRIRCRTLPGALLVAVPKGHRMPRS